MNFSKEEFIVMFFVLGESDKNCLFASKVYATWLPDKHQPETRSYK